MNEIATTPMMTTEELLALPEDGTERYLIRGQLRERAMTKRNRWHSELTIQIGYLIKVWLKQQPKPRGKVLGGEAGCILSHNPDSTVGIDVVYISADVVTKQTDETTLIDGVPTLVVEILSPSDTQEDIDEKIDEYLAAGVPFVWIVDPHDTTVTEYRPGAKPRLYATGDEIACEPHMPGFRAAVADIFEQ